MEPRIQYAQTADGVSIAYWTMGDGLPLVLMPAIPLSHIQMEYQIPGCRTWYDGLSQSKRLVRYDCRGSGLSTREVTDWSFDTHALDLEAVVDQLRLDRFALMAASGAGPVAMAYAARHPERVSHLILWCSYLRASDAYDEPLRQAMARLRDADYETFIQTVVNMHAAWSGGDETHHLAELYREGTEPETLRLAYEAFAQIDATRYAPQIGAPTLVVHRRQLRRDVGLARDLASTIPDARLALLEGDSSIPWRGDLAAALEAINEFLGEGEEVAAPAVVPSGLVTILFTDMESSTALTQRLGDEKAQELVRAHNAIVRDALQAHGGSEIKHTGDGIMASFTTASKALECAVAIQRVVEGRSAVSDQQSALRVRIGLNAGEPVAEEEDLFGTAVQLARRVCDHAEPGEILASNVVRELAAGKGFLFADQGETALRGFEDPVRLYEVRWREG